MGESRFRAVAKTVNHGWYVEYDDTGETVCDLYFKDGADIVECDNAEPNAHPIASAPDMASRISQLEAENARLREALGAALDQWQGFVKSDYEGTQSYQPMMDAVDAVSAALEDSEATHD